MIKNRKRKAFTIVELVIVIAVIAILAAVLIPTFAGIIARANESADIQAVRQMNMALLSESVENPPEGIQDVINILAAAGYNAQEKLIPVSSKHGFYWCEPANMITLIKDEGNDTPELIFPLDNETLTNAFNDSKAGGLTTDEGFYDLETSYKDSQIPNNEIEGDPLLFVLQQLESGVTIEDGAFTNGTATVTVSTDEGIVTITLGGACTIDEPVEINGNVSIDLKGNNTLTITDKEVTGETTDTSWSDYSDVITISNGASLSITNTSDGGGLVLDEVDGNAEGNLGWVDFSVYAGIYVVEGGRLNISGVTITGNRGYNIINSGNLFLGSDEEGIVTSITVDGGYGIENYGPATIKNTTFNVKGDYGCGFANYYSDDDNPEAVKITDGSFVAAGSNVSPLNNSGGTVSISETDFTKGLGFSSYDTAPIRSDGGVITLDDASIDADVCVYGTKRTDANGVVTGYANITVNSGSYSGKFRSNSGATITVKGGSFGVTAFAGITEENAESVLCYDGQMTATANPDGSWLLSSSK